MLKLNILCRLVQPRRRCSIADDSQFKLSWGWISYIYKVELFTFAIINIKYPFQLTK